jgi:ABC-type sugar transport system substrate-binding protein
MPYPERSLSRRAGRRRYLLVAAAATATVVTLSACSSDKKDNSAAANTGGQSTGGAGSPCMTAADNYLKPWDALATELPKAYTPLTKKPTPGTVIKLVGPIPSDAESQVEQAAAARSVGWTAKKISFDGSVEDLNAKFEQAVSQKPQMITLAGWPVAAISKPIEDAKMAGIAVVLSSVADVPDSYPGFSAVSAGGPTAKKIGEMNAYEFMRDSNCKGSVAIFNLPFPILKVATDAFTSAVQANCPDCKVSYNEIQTKDIGTPAATNAIVSKLQSSPSTKYVYAIIGNVATGLSAALSQAGLSGVKIFGQVPDDNAIKALRDGTNAWWVNESSLIDGWGEFDYGLRAIETGKPVVDTGDYPLAILTPKNVPSGTGLPVTPPDFRKEFEKLWTAGS